MFLKKKACTSSYGQVSSQRCCCVHAHVCAYVHIEIWVLTKIHVPEKESLYFCVWTTFLSGMILCTCVSLCTCARRNLSAFKNSCSWKRKLVLLHLDYFPLRIATVYTCTLCTCACGNLSAYWNSCSWKRKLVLLHIDKFPLSDVTVYTRMFVQMCA